MRARTLAACVLVGGLVLGAVRADERPVTRAEIDKRLAKTVHDVSLDGSKLWNEGNLEGCFRLYQGALIGLEPMLDHRPKLALAVRDRLDEAQDMKAAQGAFVLRKALDAIQRETADALTPDSAWKRMGGEAGVRAIVRDFLLAAATDPKVNITQGGKYRFDARRLDVLSQALVEQIGTATGGPRFALTDLKAALGGLRLTEAEFNAALGHLAAVLKEYALADDDAKLVMEAAGKLRSYVAAP